MGLFSALDTAAMVAAGVPWSEEDAVGLGFTITVHAAADAPAIKDSLKKQRISGFWGWGWPDLLGKSARSIPELVAPYLVEGQLHITCTWSKVDMVGLTDVGFKSIVQIPTRRPTWQSGMHNEGMHNEGMHNKGMKKLART